MFGLNVDWTGWIVVDRRLELQNIEQQLPDMWKLIRHRELYAIETLTANKSIANTESCTQGGQRQKEALVMNRTKSRSSKGSKPKAQDQTNSSPSPQLDVYTSALFV